MAREQAIADLDRAVGEAVQFFAQADEYLTDGCQSARDVISHLVFWHREYVRIVSALAHKRTPRPLTGKFREFNALATQSFARQSLPALARRLATLQLELARELDQLENWRTNFPHKQGAKFCTVRKRIGQIAAHIEGHVTRLERAERRMQGTLVQRGVQ